MHKVARWRHPKSPSTNRQICCSSLLNMNFYEFNEMEVIKIFLLAVVVIVLQICHHVVVCGH